MVIERQALPFVHVHRRRNCNVGDRFDVADEPFGRRQPGVKDAGKPVPVGRLLVDDCFGSVFKSGLTTYSTR